MLSAAEKERDIPRSAVRDKEPAVTCAILRSGLHRGRM